MPSSGVRPGDDRPGEKIRHTPRRRTLTIYRSDSPESDDGLFARRPAVRIQLASVGLDTQLRSTGTGSGPLPPDASRPTSAVSAARSGPTCGGSISPTPCRGMNCPASASTTLRARRRSSFAKSDPDTLPAPCTGPKIPDNARKTEKIAKRQTIHRCRAGFRTTNSIQ